MLRKRNTVTDLYLNIAGVTFKVSGLNYDFFKYRVRKYLCEKVENPDIVLTYRESDDIKIPPCKIIKTDVFRVFAENETHYLIYDTLKEESNSALIEISRDGKHADCVLFDVEGSNNICIFLYCFSEFVVFMGCFLGIFSSIFCSF